ncbi:UNVERIFIED_CONTAM: hypothetical protein HDU68_002483 [Siphonaria sp. JEL0065]|nr:hypothetical protein HDU68_002483 [Siphonaria sp. JEL0065]
MLSIRPYEEPTALPPGTISSKAVGYSNVSVNENFEESLIESNGGTVENIGGMQVVITGGRKGAASRARVYEKVTPQDEYLREDVSLSSIFSSLFTTCFDADTLDPPIDPIIYKRNPTWKRPDNYNDVDTDDLGTGDYYPYPVPTTSKTVRRQGSTLILPRSSSLTSSVLSTDRILSRVLSLIEPAGVQRISRVNKLWRNIALIELARNSVNIELSWHTSPTTTAKWTAKFIVDVKHTIDPSTCVIQLRPWNFGSFLHANNPFLIKANTVNTFTVIPAPQISSITFHFPSLNDPLKTFKKTPKNCIVYDTTTNYFAVSQQFVMNSDTSLPSDVLLTENCGIFFASSGCTVDSIRIGALEQRSIAGMSFLERVKLSSSMYSQSRWLELMKAESEIIHTMSGKPRAVGTSASPLEKCFESCAVRNYLSCPSHLRIWAFKQVLITMLSPNPSQDLTPGQEALASAIAKLAKVAHRVDILLMLDMSYAQRRERLNEYHLEAWKIWMGLSIGGEDSSSAQDKPDLIQLEENSEEEDEVEFEEVDLSADEKPKKLVETAYPPVGGGVSLRVSGYTGSLKDYESVYDHIQNVLLVEFS